MGIGDLGKQAGDFIAANSDKVQDALKSEQAEQVSDGILDKVADLADKVTGGKHADQIADLRDKADGAVGNQ